MLTYALERGKGKRLYEELYRCIKEDILSGELPPGERLPSKRSLAGQFGVSRITVEGAYDQLMAEGYIYAIPKTGYFVADVDVQLAPRATPASRVGMPGEEPRAYFADFAANSVNPEDFPLQVWIKLMRAVAAEKAGELLIRPPAGGILELRQAIASHLMRFRGLSADPGQIIIGAGTEYLYSLLVKLLGRENTFCVENPGYDKIRKIYESNGARCVYAVMDGQGVLPEDIERQDADIVHISPSHHFPTGIVTPIRRRYELLGWASGREGRYIIEDDYDSEFRLTGTPLPTMMGIDVEGKVIYMNTFSRSLTATMRISYMVLPPTLVERFYRKLGFYSCTVSNFEQYTLAKFIRDGFFEKHINRMRNRYRKRRAHLMGVLRRSPWAKKAHIIEEGSGLHFLLRLDTELPDGELQERLERAGLRLKPLAAYGKDIGEEAKHIFVMNYSHVQEDIMEEAILRLGQCL